MDNTTVLIPLSMMKVDSSYQRTLDEKRVNSIASKWDYMQANLIHLSHRTDGFYVIDGNHTRSACEKIGGTELPCRVHEGLTVEDEARLFYELNSSQKKPKYAEILRARAAAGCEPDRSYLQALNDANVPYSLSQSSGNKIRCHSSLMSIYRKTNYDLMVRALKAAYLAADGREEFYQIGLFSGICSLITSHPEINDDRLVNMVKKTTASKIREISDVYRRAVIGGTTSTTKDYMLAYIDLYNKGLRKGKIEK